MDSPSKVSKFLNEEHRSTNILRRSLSTANIKNDAELESLIQKKEELLLNYSGISRAFFQQRESAGPIRDEIERLNQSITSSLANIHRISLSKEGGYEDEATGADEPSGAAELRKEYVKKEAIHSILEKEKEEQLAQKKELSNKYLEMLERSRALDKRADEIRQSIADLEQKRDDLSAWDIYHTQRIKDLEKRINEAKELAESLRESYKTNLSNLKRYSLFKDLRDLIETLHNFQIDAESESADSGDQEASNLVGSSVTSEKVEKAQEKFKEMKTHLAEINRQRDDSRERLVAIAKRSSDPRPVGTSEKKTKKGGGSFMRLSKASRRVSMVISRSQDKLVHKASKVRIEDITDSPSKIRHFEAFLDARGKNALMIWRMYRFYQRASESLRPKLAREILEKGLGVVIDDEKNTWEFKKEESHFYWKMSKSQIDRLVSLCTRGTPPVYAFNNIGEEAHFLLQSEYWSEFKKSKHFKEMLEED